MKYEAKLIGVNDETLMTFDADTNATDVTHVSNLPKDFRFPRSFRIKNIEENRTLYSQLFKQIGNVLRVESDQINGLFEINIDGEEIVLKEIVSTKD